MFGKAKATQKYLDFGEYLIAAISHLSANQFNWARTVPSMAHELGLEANRLRTMFTSFPGLFRQSSVQTSGEYSYGLQLRYAMRAQKRSTASKPEYDYPTLSIEQTRMLMDFVMSAAESERVGRRAFTANILTIGAATVAAIAAVVAATISPN